MRSLPCDELLARLGEARAAAGPGVRLAFDADGTLWSGDVTRDLVAFAMSERPLRAETLAPLQELARGSGVTVEGEPHAQLAAIVVAYSAGRLAEPLAVQGVCVALAGRAEPELDELIEAAIERASLDARSVGEVRPVFDWAARLGVPVVVVSASPRRAVRAALRRLGLPVAAVLGAELRVAGARVLPELSSGVLVGDEKVRALAAERGAPVLAAFGDDVRDLPLLASARLAVAVRPTDALRARAAEVPGLVELERALPR